MPVNHRLGWNLPSTTFVSQPTASPASSKPSAPTAMISICMPLAMNQTSLPGCGFGPSEAGDVPAPSYRSSRRSWPSWLSVEMSGPEPADDSEPLPQADSGAAPTRSAATAAVARRWVASLGTMASS